jgi:hypothetical protein
MRRGSSVSAFQRTEAELQIAIRRPDESAVQLAINREDPSCI